MAQDELLQEINSLRADIQELPDRIISAASKKIEREVMNFVWLLAAVGVFYAIWQGQWDKAAWGAGIIGLYLISKRVFRRLEK